LRRQGTYGEAGSTGEKQKPRKGDDVYIGGGLLAIILLIILLILLF
jgi:hypothetical protein